MWLKVISRILESFNYNPFHAGNGFTFDFQYSCAMRAKDGRVTLFKVERAGLGNGRCEGLGGSRLW